MNDKVKVYFTQDTEDIELIKYFLKLVDYLDIFDIYLSSENDSNILNAEREKAIINCDVFIVLLTRRGKRSNLVKAETIFANINNKIIIPLLDQSSTISKPSDVFGNAPQIHFLKQQKQGLLTSLESVVQRLQLLQNKLNP
jgi:hypothetical protein